MTLTPGIEQLEANVTVIQAGSGDITVGDGAFLINADFLRSGSDLIISGADGAKVIVVGYFNTGTPANLLSDGGAMINGELVDILAGPQAPGQYAQAAGTQDGPAPIGTVVNASGNVAATRADGSSVTLVEGAPVFAGDVILTATGSTVSLAFLDGTVFNMAESGRMVLNNLVYEEGGSNNAMLFSLLQGGFSFFAGQIAPTGDMQVTTPVATLGIRGTSPWVFSSDGIKFAFSILQDPNTEIVGSYSLFSLINGQPLATVSATATKFELASAGGTPQEVTKTPEELAADQVSQQQLATAFNNAQPFIQQLQGGQPGGQQRGDLNDGNQQDTSAPVPAAGPEFAQFPSSGISAENIAESQSEDIAQTESTTGNSFALDPFESSGFGGSSSSGITGSELLTETSDGVAPIETAEGGDDTAPPPQETSGAPVITLPGSPTITEDTSIVLSGFNIQDNSGSTLNVQITAQSTVTLASTDGLNFLTGDGTDDEVLIFEGTAEDINNALNGMVYNPTPNNDVVGGLDITVSNGSTETSASLTVVIEGENDAPVAVNDTDTVVEGNSLNNIDVLDNDFDVDGDDLMVVGATAANGTVSINADNTLNYTPDEGFTGTDTIIYTISDGTDPEPLTDTANVKIEVTPDTSNADPVANDDVARTSEDTVLQGIVVLSNDTDADEDPLTVTGATALNGTVLVNSDGTIDYTPNADFYGTDTIIYDISDGNGGTGTGAVTVTVDPVNDKPVANDDTISTDEDTPVNIDVLANDVDVDGDPLTVTDAFLGGSDTSGDLVVQDEPVFSNQVVFVSNATALTGSVTINNNGTLDYTPPPDFTGTDIITYTIADGNGGTDTGTVTVTVDPVNDAPIANPDTASIDEDTPIGSIDVLVNDTDIDGGPLTVISATSSQGNVAVNPDGTLSFDPAGQFDNLSDGEVPDSTTATITYTVSDGAGGTDTGTVTVTVTGVNDAPVAADDAFTIDGTTVLNGDLFADNGAGIDDDVDDFSQIEVIEVNGLTGAAGEPITLESGAQVTVNPDGTFSYDAVGIFDSLGAGQSTTETFTYTITDFNGGTSTATVNITIEGVNDPPVADDETDFTNEDTPLLGIDVLTGDTDIDGDELFVSEASAENGTVTINLDGTLNYTPNANFFGKETITYTVSDGNGGTDIGNVFVTVGSVNDAPIVDQGIADQSTPIDTTFSFAIPAGAFSDVEDLSSELTYTAQLAGGGDLPAWLTFDGTTFSGTPDNFDGGAVTIEVTATDTGGLTASTTFDVVVEPLPGATPGDDPELIGTPGDDFVDGLAGNDFIDGLGGDDLLLGSAGNDIIESGGSRLEWEGRDKLDGGSGDDELISEGGLSLLIGGEGNDIIRTTTTFSGDEFWDWANADYKTSTSGIFANLTGSIILASVSGLSQDLAQGEVWDGFGTVDQIGIWNGESISGGVHVIRDSTHDDQIFVDGSYFNNFNNWIEVRLTAGDDHVDFTGMTGTARISWQNALGGVNASLETGTATDVNPSDNFIGFDTFIGATYLRGSRHDDMLFGDSGDNVFRGSAGSDFIDGARGIDRIDHSDSASGIVVDLSLTSNQVIDDGFGTTDDLANIENVRGSYYDDQITGGGLDNNLRGYLGNDILKGGGGHDILYGDIGDQGGLLGGNDILDGGAGFDILIGGDGADIFVLRPGTDTDTINDFSIADGDKIDVSAYGFTSVDQFSNALSVVGGNTIINPDDNGSFIVQGVDLTTNPNSHFIFSTDLIVIDQFAAGDFDFIFDSAFYVLNQNNDPISYGVTMTGTPSTTAFSLENAADSSRITNFIGSGFTYDPSGNVTGGTIDQVTFTLWNGQTTETLAIANGLDVLATEFFIALEASPNDNGVALDNLFLSYQFDYESGAGDQVFSGGLESDVMTGGAGNDTLEGDAGSDWIEGNAGIDFIDGGDGDDTLNGGLGDDTLIGGAGADVYEWAAGDGFDTVQSTGDNANGDVIKILGFEHYDANWSWNANDLFVGMAINNSYNFNDTGSVRIEGFRTGASSISYYELDTQFNSFYSSDDTVTRIYLTSGTEGIDQGGYTELVVGTEGNDVITSGGGFRDYLYGAGGDDMIYGDDATRSDLRGGDGADQLFGGSNVDRLAGGQGNDILDGGDGTDMARYDRDNGADGAFVNLSSNAFTADFEGLTETLAAGAAIDTWNDIDTLISIEDVRGSEFADIIIGSDAANVLDGRGGDDILAGGAGIDTLRGGSGTDTFIIDQADVGTGDVIADYIINEGDIVDLTELFEVNVNNDESLLNFVQVSQDDVNKLQVDVDGAANGQVWQDVATLDTSGGVNILYNLDGTDTSETI